jgi:uncharacterized membrane protein YcaP (DUF421 family)
MHVPKDTLISKDFQRSRRTLDSMWHAIFGMGVGLGEKVIRSVLIYAFLVVAFRFAGKRELGQANTLDLVVLLLVGNAVQNGLLGNDLSVTGACIGAASLLAINALFNRALYEWPRFSELLEGEPTPLIRDGELEPDALRRQGISLSELRAIARRQGFPNLGAVDSATLETNGVVTMFAPGEANRYHPHEPRKARPRKRRRGPQS